MNGERKYKHPIINIETQKKVKEVLQSGLLSGFRASPEFRDGGKFVQQLQAEFKIYFGVRHAIALNSATAGLHAALIACGVREGDEVIVPPYSFSSSASCVLMVGAKPVFADIDRDTFCLDFKHIESKITPRTKAVIPVHLMGHLADMYRAERIARRYNLKIIEDAAQAIGAKYQDKFAGTIGDCGVFSFNQSKQISSGEGGMLVTSNDKIARIVRGVRNHAEISDPELGIVGFNYRMCEIEAIIALGQFKNLEENIAHRNKLASYLSEQLSQIRGLTPPVIQPGCRHSFYTYGVKFNEETAGISRDEFQDEMIKRGVYFGKGYVKPLHLLPVFGGRLGQCPVAERMWQKELMVTDILRPPATIEDMDKIIKTMKEILNETMASA